MPIFDEIIDLNVSVTRFNQQVLSTVLGVLSDVLDSSTDSRRHAEHEVRATDEDVYVEDSEATRAKNKVRDAVETGLGELSDKFDHAAASVRRRSRH